MSLLVSYYIRKAQGIPDPPVLREEDLSISFFTTRDQPLHEGPRGVRITHIPTGYGVSSGKGRSRLENTDRALKNLRSRL